MAKNKIRVKRDGDGATVKMILKHPMETGARKDVATGKPIPQHFIQELRCQQNGELVFSANWGSGMAKNPYLSFRLREAKPGDRIVVEWTDNLGTQDSVSTTLK